MAKQSGLHQIRGKVGEHSYYKQSGVSSGLIRSINQGMSARVKNDEAFANTRLNNAEFGQAGAIAAVLGKLVVPKYRPMILPFSQSKMAKTILEEIKTAAAPWGQRNVTINSLPALLDALNSVSKNDFEAFGISASIENDKFRLDTDDSVFPQKLAAIGAEGVDVVVAACRPWIGYYNQADGKYTKSIDRKNTYTKMLDSGGQDIEIDYSFPVAPASGSAILSYDFFVVIVLPYRNINNTKHTLQEYCTFAAMETPAEA